MGSRTATSVTRRRSAGSRAACSRGFQRRAGHARHAIRLRAARRGAGVHRPASRGRRPGPLQRTTRPTRRRLRQRPEDPLRRDDVRPAVRGHHLHRRVVRGRSPCRSGGRRSGSVCEIRAATGESLAGRRPARRLFRVPSGMTLPPVAAEAPGPIGSADRGIQDSNFRLCLSSDRRTGSPSGRRPRTARATTRPSRRIFVHARHVRDARPRSTGR